VNAIGQIGDDDAFPGRFGVLGVGDMDVAGQVWGRYKSPLDCPVAIASIEWGYGFTRGKQEMVQCACAYVQVPGSIAAPKIVIRALIGYDCVKLRAIFTIGYPSRASSTKGRSFFSSIRYGAVIAQNDFDPSATILSVLVGSQPLGIGTGQGAGTEACGTRVVSGSIEYVQCHVIAGFIGIQELGGNSTGAKGVSDGVEVGGHAFVPFLGKEEWGQQQYRKEFHETQDKFIPRKVRVRIVAFVDGNVHSIGRLLSYFCLKNIDM